MVEEVMVVIDLFLFLYFSALFERKRAGKELATFFFFFW